MNKRKFTRFFLLFGILLLQKISAIGQTCDHDTSFVLVDTLEVCSGSDVLLELEIAEPVPCNSSFFKWRNEQTAVFGLTSFTVNSVNSDELVYVEVYESSGGVNSGVLLKKDSVFLKIVTPKIVELELVSPDSVCERNTIQLKASVVGGIGGYNYDWHNDVLPTGTNIGEIVFASSGVRFDTVTVTGGDMVCPGVGKITYTVNPKPNISFQSGIDVCEGSEIRIASPNGPYPSCKWTKGALEQLNCELVVPVSDATHDGVWNLEVMDNNKCTNTSIVNVQIGNLVVSVSSADFNPAIGICLGQEITISSSPSASPNEFTITGPDNSISLDIAKKFSTNTPGNYTISLEETSGACTASGQLEVKVNTLHDVSIDKIGNFCQGNDVALEAIVTGGPSGGIFEYTWDGDTGLSGSGKEVNRNNAVKGNYYNRVFVKNVITQCKKEADISYTIYDLPIINIPNLKEFCTGAEIRIEAAEQNGNPFQNCQWSRDGTNVGNSCELVIPNANSSYNGDWDIEVTDVNQCTNTKEIEISVGNVSLTLDANGVHSSGVCKGNTFQLSSGTAMLKNEFIVHRKDPNNGTILQTLNPADPNFPIEDGGAFETNLVPAGNYTIVFTKNQGNCSGSVEYDVVINPIHAVSIDIKNVLPFYCQGNDIDLEVIVTGNSVYDFLWTGATGNSKDIVLSTPKGQNYDVTVQVLDVNRNCSVTETISIDVKETPDIDIDGDLNYCLGDEFKVSAEPDNDQIDKVFTSCKWTLASENIEVNNCELNFNSAMGKYSGDWVFSVVDNHGCSDDEIVTVQVDSSIVFMSPNPGFLEDGICPTAIIALNPNFATDVTSYRITGGGINAIENDIFDASFVVEGAQIEITLLREQHSCNNEDRISFTVNRSPEIITKDTSVCSNAIQFNLNNLVNQKGGSFYYNDKLFGVGFNVFFTAQDSSVQKSYNIDYSYVDSKGCSSTVEFTVTIEPEIKLSNVSVGSDSICDGGSVLLFSDASAGAAPLNFEWSSNIGDLIEWNQNNTGEGGSKPLEGVDKIDFTITVTDNIGCSISESVSTVIRPKPSNLQINNEVDGQIYLCKGQSATLEASFDGGIGVPTYKWEPLSSIKINNGNKIITDSINTDNLIKLKVTFPTKYPGCDFLLGNHSIEVKELPQPTIVPLFANACESSTSMFLVKGESDISKSSFTWSYTPKDFADTSDIEYIGDQNQIMIINWNDQATGNAQIYVEEAYNEGCFNSTGTTVTFGSGSSQKPAKIYRTPINNILFYNDSTASCYQWGVFKKGDTLFNEIKNETNQSYIAERLYDPEKNYWCRVSYNEDDCKNVECSTIAFYADGPVAERPETPEAKLNLFPNPNSGQFNVSFTNLFAGKTYFMNITNVLGQTVYSKEVVSSDASLQMPIEMGAADSGVYHIKLYSENNLHQVLTFIVRNK